MENSFHLHVDAKVFSHHSTIGNPILLPNHVWKWSIFLLFKMWFCVTCSTYPKFYFGHGWINFKPYEFIHLCICSLIAYVSRFAMIVWSLKQAELLAITLFFISIISVELFQPFFFLHSLQKDPISQLLNNVKLFWTWELLNQECWRTQQIHLIFIQRLTWNTCYF